MSVGSSRIKLHHFPGRCERSCILAQSRHYATGFQCPLLGVKRTLIGGVRCSSDRGLMALAVVVVAVVVAAAGA